MAYLLLIGAVLLSAVSSIGGKFYNRANADRKDPNRLYTLLMYCSVLAGWWILFLTDFDFEAKVLPYAAVFGVSYTLSTASVVYALKYGPASLTQLIVSMSLIVAAVWGILFWGESLTWLVAAGLMFAVAALVLTIYSGRRESRKVSFKWVLFVLLAFVGNASCTITQRTEQMMFHGQYGNMLMAFAMIPAAIIGVVSFLKSDRRDMKIILKKTWFVPVIVGVTNLLVNLVVMMLVQTDLTASLIYPVIGVGGLSVVLIVSLAAFREKLRWWQWIGIAFGAAATVLLSI
ncbi:MAG: EamA family transporter [Lachnospiraceae bacterium]|nr:EamA family transporter [Lachnospiraceae bacterium]